MKEVPAFKELRILRRIRRRFTPPVNSETGADYLTGRTKRILDITTAASLLPIAIPLVVTSAVINKLLQPNEPAFYKSRRLGKDARLINIWKLRTLKSTTKGEARPSQIDKVRFYAFGSFMKRFRIDELPQLISILKGDLSFVGVRAMATWDMQRIADKTTEDKIRLPKEVALEDFERWQKLYLKYTPGCTNLTYNLNCNNQTTAQRIRLDTFFLEHANLRLDLYVRFLLTPYTLITGRGIS